MPCGIPFVSPIPVFRSCLIVIDAFVTAAVFFLMGKLPAAAAAVAEFLLIAGGTGTIAACLTVVGECTGIRVFALMFTAHEITLLFPHYSPEKKCIQELCEEFSGKQ